MSMITENTIVVRTEDIDAFMAALKKQKEEHGGIENSRKVFKNDEVAIFVFDCNGQPFVIEKDVNWLVLETNFLDGDEYYTQWFNEETGCYEDTDTTADELIKQMLDEKSYAIVKEKIRYTVEKDKQYWM